MYKMKKTLKKKKVRCILVCEMYFSAASAISKTAFKAEWF